MKATIDGTVVADAPEPDLISLYVAFDKQQTTIE